MIEVTSVAHVGREQILAHIFAVDLCCILDKFVVDLNIDITVALPSSYSFTTGLSFLISAVVTESKIPASFMGQSSR